MAQVEMEQPRVEVEIPRKCPQCGHLPLHFEGSYSIMLEQWRARELNHLKIYHCSECGHVELVLPIFKEGEG